MADNADSEDIQILIKAINETKEAVEQAKAGIEELKNATEEANQGMQEGKKGAKELGDGLEEVGKKAASGEKGMRIMLRMLKGGLWIQAARDIYGVVRAMLDMNDAVTKGQQNLADAEGQVFKMRATLRRVAETMFKAGEITSEELAKWEVSADGIASMERFKKLAKEIATIRSGIEKPVFGNLVAANAFAQTNTVGITSTGPAPRIPSAIAQSGLALQKANFEKESLWSQDALDHGEITLEQYHEKVRASQAKFNEMEITATRAMFAEQLDAANITKEERVALETEQGETLQEIHVRQRMAEVEYDRKVEEEKRQIREKALKGAQDMFGNLAEVALAFGEKGFAAYKALMTAQAIVATFTSAVQAYNAMSGLPVVGPALGAIAAAAAVAAGMANIAKIQSAQPQGYAEGGLIPGTPSDRDNRLAYVATGEFVLPASVVKDWGAAHFEAYRRGATPGSGRRFEARPVSGSHFASGGLVGAASASAAPSIGVINTREDMRRFQATDGVKIIVDQLRRRSNVISL